MRKIASIGFAIGALTVTALPVRADDQSIYFATGAIGGQQSAFRATPWVPRALGCMGDIHTPDMHTAYTADLHTEVTLQATDMPHRSNGGANPAAERSCRICATSTGGRPRTGLIVSTGRFWLVQPACNSAQPE
jgi:hypothetical protein